MRSIASPRAHSQYFIGVSTHMATIQGAIAPPSWKAGQEVSTRPVRRALREVTRRRPMKPSANAFARSSKWIGAVAAITATRNMAMITGRVRVAVPATFAYRTTEIQPNQMPV